VSGKLHDSDAFKAALELRLAIIEAPPADGFASAMVSHLPDIEAEIEMFVKSLAALHDLIDIRRCLMGTGFAPLVEWAESSIYTILHSRKV
jgi:hypothetical protein